MGKTCDFCLRDLVVSDGLKRSYCRHSPQICRLSIFWRHEKIIQSSTYFSLKKKLFVFSSQQKHNNSHLDFPSRSTASSSNSGKTWARCVKPNGAPFSTSARASVTVGLWVTERWHHQQLHKQDNNCYCYCYCYYYYYFFSAQIHWLSDKKHVPWLHHKLIHVRW